METKASTGTRQWHLKALENANLVQSSGPKHHTYYWPTGIALGESLKLYRVVNTKPLNFILKLVLEKPGIVQKNILKAVNISKDTDYVKHLLEENFIWAFKDGRYIRFFPNKEKILKLYEGYEKRKKVFEKYEIRYTNPMFRYAALLKEKPIEQPLWLNKNTSMVLRCVFEYPYTNLTTISIHSKLNPVTTTNRLAILTKLSLIRKEEYGELPIYTPNGEVMDKVSDLYKVLNFEPQKRVFIAIMGAPGGFSKELAKSLELAKSSIMGYLDNLESAGFITTVKEGRFRRSFPTTKLDQLDNYHQKHREEYEAQVLEKLLKYAKKRIKGNVELTPGIEQIDESESSFIITTDYVKFRIDACVNPAILLKKELLSGKP